MTVVAVEPVITDFAEEVYDRLADMVGRGGTFTYVAEEWLEQLLRPLGYERSDQSRVTIALKALGEAGLVKRASVRALRGYHADRRCDWPKPRKVDITILR